MVQNAPPAGWCPALILPPPPTTEAGGGAAVVVGCLGVVVFELAPVAYGLLARKDPEYKRGRDVARIAGSVLLARRQAVVIVVDVVVVVVLALAGRRTGTAPAVPRTKLHFETRIS